MNFGTLENRWHVNGELLFLTQYSFTTVVQSCLTVVKFKTLF